MAGGGVTRRYPYAMPKGLRWEIFARDKACVLSFLEEGHVCKDVWSQVHAPNDFDRLTLEHVHVTGSMMGKRAPNEARSLVALCGLANFEVPSKAQRDAFRAYLDGIYGPVAA
jgi:hypothetical protein